MHAGSRCVSILLISTIGHAADLPPMLNLPGTGQDPERIDFRNMPILRGEQSIVSHGNAPWPFRNHAYVTWFDGRFWSMWSHGLRQEDYPSQHIRYSVSTDGRVWSEAKIITRKAGVRWALFSSSPFQSYTAIPDYLPNEPALLTVPDGRLVALFRSCQVDAHFPFLRTSRGFYVLVSNANPAPLQRVPLCLSVSDDGITFTRIARLPIPTAPQDYLLNRIAHHVPSPATHGLSRSSELIRPLPIH